MATINNVSFTGTAVTKNGNLYNNCKTGRKIGTIGGLLLGAGAASSPIGSMAILGVAGKICEKFPKANPYIFAIATGVAALGITATTLIGRALGALPDALVNKGRKKEADTRVMNDKA